MIALRKQLKPLSNVDYLMVYIVYKARKGQLLYEVVIFCIGQSSTPSLTNKQGELLLHNFFIQC